jgi:hypothetical protein
VNKQSFLYSILYNKEAAQSVMSSNESFMSLRRLALSPSRMLATVLQLAGLGMIFVGCPIDLRMNHNGPHLRMPSPLSSVDQVGSVGLLKLRTLEKPTYDTYPTLALSFPTFPFVEAPFFTFVEARLLMQGDHQQRQQELQAHLLDRDDDDEDREEERREANREPEARLAREGVRDIRQQLQALSLDENQQSDSGSLLGRISFKSEDSSSDDENGIPKPQCGICLKHLEPNHPRSRGPFVPEMSLAEAYQ